jgi:hypothetical protein
MMETPRKIPYSPRPRSNRPLSLGPSAMARRAIAKSWQSVVFRRVPEVSRNPALAPFLLAAAESRLERYPSETEVWSTLGSVGVSVSGSMASTIGTGLIAKRNTPALESSPTGYSVGQFVRRRSKASRRSAGRRCSFISSSLKNSVLIRRPQSIGFANTGDSVLTIPLS